MCPCSSHTMPVPAPCGISSASTLKGVRATADVRMCTTLGLQRLNSATVRASSGNKPSPAAAASAKAKLPPSGEGAAADMGCRCRRYCSRHAVSLSRLSRALRRRATSSRFSKQSLKSTLAADRIALSSPTDSASKSRCCCAASTASPATSTPPARAAAVTRRREEGKARDAPYALPAPSSRLEASRWALGLHDDAGTPPARCDANVRKRRVCASSRGRKRACAAMFGATKGRRKRAVAAARAARNMPTPPGRRAHPVLAVLRNATACEADEARVFGGRGTRSGTGRTMLTCQVSGAPQEREHVSLGQR